MKPLPLKKIQAWECIGCGKIEAPQPCIGVCEDQPVELVRVDQIEALAAERDRVVEDNSAMRDVLLSLAGTTPRNGQWEAGYRALQERAAELLERLERRQRLAI